MWSELPAEWESQPLYYESPTLLRFNATVRRVDTAIDGFVVVVDRSSFYPEGGGQPADRGTLGGAPVTHVEKSKGVIRHFLSRIPVDAAGTPVTPGATVTGEVDADHRRTYAQQHSGQHVLSGALYRVAGLNTLSVHQGEQFTTIEVDTASVTPSQLYAVQDAANRIIEEDRPIGDRWVAHDEISSLELRRPPKVDGVIRVVEVSDWDRVACGGVHLRRTGEIRLVLTAGTESIRGNTRIRYLIGDRAVGAAQTAIEELSRAGDLLSVPSSEVALRVSQLIRQITESKSRIASLTESLGQAVANRLLGASAGDRLVIASILDEADASFLRSVMEHLIAEPTVCALLLSRERQGAEKPDRLLWSMGFAAKCGVRFSDVRRLLPLIEGKGGGRGEIAQGVGARVEGAPQLLQAFRDICHRQ